MTRLRSRSFLRPWCAPSFAALTVLAAAACTPTLDWREVAVDGGVLTAVFPCKPERRTRIVPLAGESAPMHMLACAAGGDTYATSFVDVADPARVSATLGALRQATVENLQGTATPSGPLRIAGATPNPSAVRVHVLGQLPDGRRVEAHAAFFVRGLRVYQVSVIGPAPDRGAVTSFVIGLKLAT